MLRNAAVLQTSRDACETVDYALKDVGQSVCKRNTWCSHAEVRPLQHGAAGFIPDRGAP